MHAIAGSAGFGADGEASEAALPATTGSGSLPAWSLPMNLPELGFCDDEKGYAMLLLRIAERMPTNCPMKFDGHHGFIAAIPRAL